MKALNMIVAVLLNDRWRGPAIRHRWHQSIRRFWRRREKDWQKENVKTASQGREKTAETGVWLISKSIQKFIVIAIKKNLLFLGNCFTRICIYTNVLYYQDFWKFSKIFINSEFFLPQTLGWRRRAEREERAWGSHRETAKEGGGSDEGGGGSEGN